MAVSCMCRISCMSREVRSCGSICWHRGYHNSMVDINFDSLLRTEVFISGLDQRLQESDAVLDGFRCAVHVSVKSTIFLTLAVAGCGRCWIRSTPHESLRLFRGKGSCVATTPTSKRRQRSESSGNSLLRIWSPTELVLGVSGDYFESTFGANYPAFHEEGAEKAIASRPVYELIAAGERFEERISQLGEKYQREEIAILERSF